MNKAILRSLQAAIFAIGAPLGWLLIRYAGGTEILEELKNNWGLYSYMLFGTTLVFIIFGVHVGRQEQATRELSIRDPLTGIYNLRFYIERIGQEISRAKRYDTPLSMIYFDLDYFKKVNDQYGHPIGDKVLCKIAEQVKDSVRAHDVFARVGGEEFAILLPRSNVQDAAANAERIRQAIENLTINVNNTLAISVTVSAGVTQWQNDEAVAEFYKRADEKLYLAKQQGRNQVVY